MVVVSAPGKILLAGGYLVLEESNCGLVVAVNRRFYCQCDVDHDVVVPIEDADKAAASGITTTIISVQSPQFATEWKYLWDGQTLRGDTNNTSSNVFIEKTLRVVLSYLAAEGCLSMTKQSKTTMTKHIRLKVAADNDFYSLLPHLQQRQLRLDDGDQLPRFLPAAAAKQQPPTNGDSNGTVVVLKTGLGSSACLVTAVVAALVQTLLSPQRNRNDNDDADAVPPSLSLLPIPRICALAQLAHCYAQGKIGSGFDVSAACYGSHVYRRFSPTLLQDVLTALDDDHDAATTDDCRRLIQSVVNSDHSILGHGVQQPVHSFDGDNSFLQVMMADVSMGSESPSMAKAILQWKSAQQKTGDDNDKIPYWDDLAVHNQTIIELLSQLPPPHPHPETDDEKNRSDRRSPFAALPASEWSQQLRGQEPILTDLLLRLRETFGQIRRHLKALGEAAGGVPVEPDLQTALCDATSCLPGVIATLVPGAGGYDAVACVYVNDRTVRAAVAHFWTTDWPIQQQQQHSAHGTTSTTTTVVCPLTVAGVDHGYGLVVEDQFPCMANLPSE
jgi:phosphomevalonate kinase